MLRLYAKSPSRHSFQLSMDYLHLVLGPGTCTLTDGTILSTRDISPGCISLGRCYGVIRACTSHVTFLHFRRGRLSQNDSLAVLTQQSRTTDRLLYVVASSDQTESADLVRDHFPYLQTEIGNANQFDRSSIRSMYPRDSVFVHFLGLTVRVDGADMHSSA